VADKKLEFQIGAKDEASKVFQQVGKAAKAGMGQVDDSLDGSESKGKQLAAALSQQFDKLDATMRGTREAAAMLGKALGPDLAAKVDTVGIVTEFQRLGLSVDEVKADVDALADTIRKADDISLKNVAGETDKLGSSVHNTGKKVGEMRGEADQSRSVLANMVGNSTQSMAALAGVSGDAGVAIGQMGEYATEGNISLGGLAKVAGPMAALGIAVAAVAGHMKDVAETKAFNAERVERFKDALEDSVVTANELVKVLSKDQDTGIFVRFRNDTVNADREVAQFFKTFADFKALTDEGLPGFDKWAQQQLNAAKAAGANSLEMAHLKAALDDVRDGSIKGENATLAMADGNEALLKTALALTSVMTGQSSATKNAGFQEKFYGDALDDAGAASKRAAGQADAQTAALLQAAAAASGPARAGILAYIAVLHNIPPDVFTEIQAAIRAGDIPRATKLIDDASKNRDTTIVVDADTSRARSAIASVINQRYNAQLGVIGPAPHARGGTVGSSEPFQLVGEQGPELVKLPTGSRVHTAGETRGIFGSGTPVGGNTVHMTVNVTAPLGSDPTAFGREVANAVARYSRVNGSGWLRNLVR
jgi:hypothetical protein